MPCRRLLHCNRSRWYDQSRLAGGLANAIAAACFKRKPLTLGLAGQTSSTHLTFPHGDAVKARCITAGGDFAAAAIRRVGVVVGFFIRAAAGSAAIIRLLRDDIPLAGLGCSVITARILAAGVVFDLSWSLCNDGLRRRAWVRARTAVAPHG